MHMAHHKTILLVSSTARLHDRMRALGHSIDVSIALANHDTLSQALHSGHEFDLVILDSEGLPQQTLSAVDAFVAEKRKGTQKPAASSFDQAVEATLKAQIKR